MTTNDLIDQLRDLLYKEPTQDAWAEICRLFDAWPPSSIDVGVDYAQRHLDERWPDELRTPPSAWRRAAIAGRAPIAWPLVCAFDVRLDNIGPRKINTIKTVRQYTGLGLKDTKELVERAPCLVLEQAGLRAARAMHNELTEIGCTATLVGATSPDTFTTHLGVMSVELVDAGPRKIQTIKTLRELLRLGLREAKDLTDDVPTLLFEETDAHSAKAFADALEAVGASVRLTPLHGGTAPTPPSPLSAQSGDFEVELVNPGKRKIDVIKIIREVTQYGLAESKRLVDESPSIIKSKLNRARAEAIVERLEQVGAMADVVEARG